MLPKNIFVRGPDKEFEGRPIKHMDFDIARMVNNFLSRLHIFYKNQYYN